MAEDIEVGGGGSEVPASGGDSGASGSTGGPLTGGTPPAAAPERYELKVGGKTIPVEGRDKMVEYAQKGYHFTQQMQELAQQRRAWESEREQVVRELQTFLSDPNQIRRYLQQIEHQQGPAAAADAADQLMTAQQAKQLLEQELQQFGARTQQEMQQMRMQFEVDQLATQYTQTLDAHIGALKGQFPEIKAIPNVERALKAQVSEMGQRNLQEAQSYMHEVASQWASSVREHLDAERKKAVPPPAAQRGIEPPGGAGPMPPAQPNFKSVKDPRFLQSVMSDLVNASKSQG